ncbi:MAG: hypothetical protein M3Z37_06545 [Candidatus Eremiobacteraeota bacterium]|nr:hypothetical protein [Candidatus Eremiobacteraeota bacterium]
MYFFGVLDFGTNDARESYYNLEPNVAVSTILQRVERQQPSIASFD